MNKILNIEMESLCFAAFVNHANLNGNYSNSNDLSYNNSFFYKLSCNCLCNNP